MYAVVDFTHIYVGSVKVWDFGTGQLLKYRAGPFLQPNETEADITVRAVQYIPHHDQRAVLVLFSSFRARCLLVYSHIPSFFPTANISHLLFRP